MSCCKIQGGSVCWSIRIFKEELDLLLYLQVTRFELYTLLLKHISCTEEKNKNMCTSSMYHIDHKGSMLSLNDCILLTNHLVCNRISTQTRHQDCCKISLYLRKDSVVVFLPHTHAWHMLSGIDVVKASKFCFIFDNRFLGVPENYRVMSTEEAWAEGTRAVLRAVKSSCKVGWQLVTFTTACCLDCSGCSFGGSLRAAVNGPVCLSGWKTAIWQWRHKLPLTCWGPELLVTIVGPIRFSSFQNYYSGNNLVLS